MSGTYITNSPREVSNYEKIIVIGPTGRVNATIGMYKTSWGHLLQVMRVTVYFVSAIMIAEIRSHSLQNIYLRLGFLDPHVTGSPASLRPHHLGLGQRVRLRPPVTIGPGAQLHGTLESIILRECDHKEPIAGTL